MEKVYNKLVRDNIPEIIIKDNRNPIYYQLPENDYWEALLQKDIEEISEVREASSKEEIKKNLLIS